MYKDEDGSSHYMVEVEEPSASNQHGTLPNSPALSFIQHEPDETTVECSREVPEVLGGAHLQSDIAPMNTLGNACQGPSIGMFGTNMSEEKPHFSPMAYGSVPSGSGGIGEACPEIITDNHQGLVLDLVLGQPGTTPYAGKMKLDVTLAPTNVEGADN